MQRRRSVAVTAAGTAAFAAMTLTGCGSDPDPDYQGVCVDQRTEQVVDDDECSDDRNDGFHGFFFWPIGLLYPAIGQRYRAYPGYTTRVPDGHVGVLGGANPRGGTVTREGLRTSVSRGGFGTTSRRDGVGG